MDFLHYFQPNPIFFQLGPLAIHWYGLILALAFIVAIALSWRLVNMRGLKTDDLLDLALWLIIAGIIGARLYDVFIIDWPYFSRHLIIILFICHGGLAIHGALIGGLNAVYFWCRLKKQNLWLWLDIIAAVLPLAQAIGRWGNYFNSELFGRPTSWPWGIPITENLRPIIYKSFQYFQPAFLYESILDLILFIIILFIFKKNQLKAGQLAGLYLIGYGLIRLIMEFIRIDITAQLFGFRVPQLVSIGMVLIGLIIFRIKSNKNVSLPLRKGGLGRV